MKRFVFRQIQHERISYDIVCATPFALSLSKPAVSLSNWVNGGTGEIAQC